MRIHSDTLTTADVHAATATASHLSPGGLVYTTRLTEHGSRSRRHAFDVLLTGSNSRSQNGNRDVPAATWDEWGWFLAHLFTVDPHAVAGPYNGAASFHSQTHGAYARNLTTA